MTPHRANRLEFSSDDGLRSVFRANGSSEELHGFVATMDSICCCLHHISKSFARCAHRRKA